MGENCDRPMIGVIHMNLMRITRDDLYRSMCPFCMQGRLSMDRDHKSKLLLKTGRCDLCGQRVEYLDFDELSFASIENAARKKGKLK